ncbi:MAG: hypothetical protein WC473_06010 [Patescibacteria group bacterium]|jgi:hypothetical protein
MKRLICLFAIAIFMSGCASFYCSKYPNCNYAATSAETIPIYNNFPPTPYEVIGEVGGDGAPASSWSGMGKRMREYAAQIGGDAIVIQSQETPYRGTYNTPTTVSTTSSVYGSATTSTYGSAYRSGNYVYGQSRGQIYGRAHGQSRTTINPGTSIPIYGKSVRAAVIKFKPLGSSEVEKKTHDEQSSIDTRGYIEKYPEYFGLTDDAHKDKGKYWHKKKDGTLIYFSTQQEMDKILMQ